MKRDKFLANIVGDLNDARGLLGELECKDDNVKEMLKGKLNSVIKYAECAQEMIQKAFTSPDYAPRRLDGIELLERLVILAQEKSEAEFIAGAAKHLAEDVKKHLAEEMTKENVFRLFQHYHGYSVIMHDGKIGLYHDVDGVEQKIDI